MSITISDKDEINRSAIIKKLLNARYERNDVELSPGNFRVKGDTLDIIPAYSEDVGYCSGIENYSRHFDGRKPGEQAFCLLDFFGDDYLLVIDESHVTLPQ